MKIESRLTLPGAVSSSEGTMEAFSTSLVCHLLLPDWEVGSIVPSFSIEGWERGPICDEGYFSGLQIRFEC